MLVHYRQYVYLRWALTIHMVLRLIYRVSDVIEIIIILFRGVTNNRQASSGLLEVFVTASIIIVRANILFHVVAIIIRGDKQITKAC